MKIRVGTRGSALALRQTEEVLRALKSLWPFLEFEVMVIKTTGDKVIDSPLFKIGSKGLFVKEIEEALLEGRIDIAVHSLKDLPTKLPSGLTIGAIPKRLDPRDVLILPKGEGRRIGTSSLRRMVQLKRLFPHFEVLPIRGNLDTRLRKLKRGEVDGLVVALAGLLRLNLEVEGVKVLDELIPAPGQGALAVECREDSPFMDLLREVNDPSSERAVFCERAFLMEMGGGCQVPLGALAEGEGREVKLKAFISSLDGERYFYGEYKGEDPVEVGRSLAKLLKGQGAEEVLRELYEGSGLSSSL
jgi:hydroxymethylbilane synthase